MEQYSRKQHKQSASRISIITILLLNQHLMHCVPTLKLQEYQKENSNQTCANALLAEKENLLVYGSVNFSSDARLWNPVLTIQYKNIFTEFTPMCVIHTSATDLTNSTVGCYCYSCSSDFKQFMINEPAKLEYSGAEIRAVMHSPNGDTVYSPTIKLPSIIKYVNTTMEIDESKLKFQGRETRSLTASTNRVCHYLDKGACNAVNGEKVNNSAGDCEVFVSFKNADVVLAVKDCDRNIDTIIKPCIVKNTDGEQNCSKFNRSIPFLLAGLVVLLWIFIVYGMWKRRANPFKIMCCRSTNIPNINQSTCPSNDILIDYLREGKKEQQKAAQNEPRTLLSFSDMA